MKDESVAPGYLGLLVDVVDVPAYSVAEAASYLSMPPRTLQSWVSGRTYSTQDGDRRWSPVIKVADADNARLSFRNLAEAHVLRTIRQVHGVTFPRISLVFDYFCREFASDHPLLEIDLKTNGVDLFTERLRHLVNVSKQGQLAVRESLESSLSRIERDDRHTPRLLYPFTRFAQQVAEADSPRVIAIRPDVAFGRPIIAGTGIRADAINDRFVSGESVEELADDYGLTHEQIEEAVRWVRRAA
ncbi:MAG: DUF433 domain-containing protein [Candidatus Eisenbacteria bacterium]|nr:DUF433 domain-containing protein [Candidatus Eisenbacteria bacterium]